MLAWFKLQAKIRSYSGVRVHGERQKYIPLSPPLSQIDGLRDIGDNMSIGNIILGVNSVTVSYLIKTVYHKMRQILLQTATEVYYKMR